MDFNFLGVVPLSKCHSGQSPISADLVLAGLPAPLDSEVGDTPMLGASTNVIATYLDRPGLKALIF